MKLPERRDAIVNRDVDQHEGAIRAASEGGQIEARGVLVTNCSNVEESAAERLALCALLRLEELVEWVKAVLDLLVEYANGWSQEASAREERRQAVEPRLPPSDLLWHQVVEPQGPWIALGEPP